jgi:uncharacterized protein YacL
LCYVNKWQKESHIKTGGIKMEKPGLEKTIIFLVIALIPVLGLTIIPKLLLKVFGNNIETLISDEYYTASIVAAIVIFILVLALSAYIALKPYIVWCLAYACGIIYSILMFIRPGEEFNSLNFYLIATSYSIDLVVLLALSLKQKK